MQNEIKLVDTFNKTECPATVHILPEKFKFSPKKPLNNDEITAILILLGIQIPLKLWESLDMQMQAHFTGI